jgi:flagellin-like protein
VVLRRRLSALLAAVMMVAMTLASGVALAEPGGQGNGIGQGVGGGDNHQFDSGNRFGIAKGEGRHNNPHGCGCPT